MIQRKNLNIAVLIILITLMGCAEQNEISVNGNWYYFTSDSIYSEVYFGRGKAIFYDENLGGGPMYQYSVKNDSIHIYYRGDLKHNYWIKLVANSLIFSGDRENYTLYPLEDQIDYFNLPSTMEAVDSFDYEFAQRMFRNKP